MCLVGTTDTLRNQPQNHPPILRGAFGTTFKTLSLAIYRPPAPHTTEPPQNQAEQPSAPFLPLSQRNPIPSPAVFWFPLLSDAHSSSCAFLPLSSFHRAPPQALPLPLLPLPSMALLPTRPHDAALCPPSAASAH